MFLEYDNIVRSCHVVLQIIMYVLMYEFLKTTTLPCLAVASTICQTELFTAPNEVSIFSLRPSLNIAYSAGHKAFKAILAHAGDCFESPKNANSAWSVAEEKCWINISTASVTFETKAEKEQINH